MSSTRGHDAEIVLGLDLGANSLGWVRIQMHQGREPARLADFGVRCFDAGVEGDIEQGKDESRAAQRRGPRQARRQIWRRWWRRRKVMRLMQRAGFLPDERLETPEALHEFLLKLDAKLRPRVIDAGERVGEQTWLYRLRAAGLDRRLEQDELARVMYHLSQRRGYKSNRKAQRAEEDEKKEAKDESGKVAKGIGELDEAMKEAGARTLGEYFARIDPEAVKLRRRWTARKWFEDEFELIWAKQRTYHAELTDELKKLVRGALFVQRPLKSQSHLVGKCELMPKRRRAMQACEAAQRFRILSAVNNLLVEMPGERERGLTGAERAAAIEALEQEGDRTFEQLRKAMGLPRGVEFNLARGGEKKLPGNRTRAKLEGVFGERWGQMTERQRDEVINLLLSVEDEGAMARLGREKWGLSAEQADALAVTQLEKSRARHCRAALGILVGRMEEGLPYATAKKDEFGEAGQAAGVCELLPPVMEALPTLRNPAVCRALTELRKVVNAIIRKHGKPELIRLELARDLRNPRKKREEMWKRNRENEKEREGAARTIGEALPGHGEATRNDKLKVLLAEECGWKCPYTGKGIEMRALVGRNAQFDIEHIWPMSKTLEDGYHNKTLCWHEENRHRKRGRTAWGAYHGTAQWDEIIARVKGFKGTMAKAKLKRFLTPDEEIESDFSESQLNDTKYASKLARGYLGLLYGGDVDADGTRRVQVSAGGVTAFLRDEWGLNGILGDGGKKSRNDHRHHAVDAVAIALTSPGTVKMLSDAAEGAAKAGKRRFAPVAEPWRGFLKEVREAIEKVTVSHRVNHKVMGQLHEETNYSTAHRVSVTDKKGKVTEVEYRHVRKPVSMLSAGEMEDIVDAVVRSRVMEKVKALGVDMEGASAAEWKKLGPRLEEDPPVLKTRDGREIPIKRVRVKKKMTTVKDVGKGARARWVAPGSNHHTVIVEARDKKGRVKWEDYPVTRLEAVRRLRAGEPVVQREWGEGKKFVMSFSPGDSVRMKVEGEEAEDVFVVCSVSEGLYELKRHRDGRPIGEIAKSGKKGGRLALTVNKLHMFGVRKVKVSPLGEVEEVKDDAGASA